MKAAQAYQQFAPLPSDESITIAWPTPNHALFESPHNFFARTRVNPDYGKPGFTRDCGKRFHRGCDIAPVKVTATGETTRVTFTDCATNTDFESVEPTLLPRDEVFCVADGKIVERVDDPMTSDFGKYVVVEHAWLLSGRKFHTLYAHLSTIHMEEQSVARGQQIGRMGQTSRSADARNWMAIAPHLHFEVRDERGRPYNPVEFLARFLAGRNPRKAP